MERTERILFPNISLWKKGRRIAVIDITLTICKLNTTKTSALSYALWADLGLLVKFKLSLMVVISSMMTYWVLAQDTFSWTDLALLSFGGLAVTFAANALNQAIERDYDKLMKRTAMRPVAAGRMPFSTAILFSGMFCLLGTSLLALLHPAAALLGMISFVMYGFVYTPLKRYSPIAIPVGAIPGALPVLIGGVAATGGFTPAVVCLFALQYLWQFPHFWSIAWLGHSDYMRAGFRLINDVDGEPDPKYGLYSAVYALLSAVPLIACKLTMALPAGIFAMMCLLILVYAAFAYQLYLHNNAAAARRLMFASFFYLPLLFGLFILGALNS
ncbi:MAG: protoheme IX farnesyltransferase [Saprospiraceae bacterium]|nr:protoheme IX farnesyltransferase [Saprospiraceae bacterium]